MRTQFDNDARVILSSIIRELTIVAPIESLWPRGLVHRGGPHYRLRGMATPISIGEDECLALARIIAETKPQNAFIIGNAFGFSSVFIACMMQRCGGRSVVTLDSTSEGDGDRCRAVAEQLRIRMNADILTNRVGWSPDDIASAADDGHYDLIFIDGAHSYPQVTRDFHGCRPLAHEGTVVFWHDYWVPGIPHSVTAAQQAGFHCLKINTSCEIVCGTRRAAVLERIRLLMPNSEAPKPRIRPRVFMSIAQMHASFLLRYRLPGGARAITTQRKRRQVRS